MPRLDFDQLLTVLSVVLAVTVLRPGGAVTVLVFVLGLVCNIKRRPD
jgi:hypothetical protein